MRQDIAKESIAEFKEQSIETSKSEMQREKKNGKQTNKQHTHRISWNCAIISKDKTKLEFQKEKNKRNGWS